MIVEESHIILPSIFTELELPFIGDIHGGARACHEVRIENDLARIANRPNAYPIFTGDQADLIVPKDTRRFSPSVCAPWVWNEEWAKEEYFPIEAVVSRQCWRLNQILDHAPQKRVLGMMEGNHETSYLKYHGHDVTRNLCKHRGWKMLGYSCFLTLVVGFEDHPRTFRVGIYASHGWGGGSRTEGYNLTKFSKIMAYYDARIYAFSHVHDIQTKIIPRLEPIESEKWKDAMHSNERIYFNDRALIVTGTYLRTLSEGRFPTYSEEKGFPPRKLGYASAVINFDGDTGEVGIGYAVR